MIRGSFETTLVADAKDTAYPKKDDFEFAANFVHNELLKHGLDFDNQTVEFEIDVKDTGNLTPPPF